MKFPPTFPGYTRQGSLMVPGYVGRAGRAPGGAAAPTTYLDDQFQAANGTALADRTMAPGPGKWAAAAIAGTWTIQSNKAVSDGTAGSRIVDDGTSGVSDNATLSADVTVQTGGGPAQGLIFRHVDADNDLNLLWDSTNVAYLTLRTTAGGETMIASAAKTLTDGQTYAFSVELNGDAISGLVDGTAVNATNSTHQSATKYGMRLGAGTTNAVDNFKMVSS